MTQTDPALSTTSYVILGHLAMQDWTMYDMARQMRRNVRYFFPRAESQVYAEPKRLERLGLATSRKEATGKRARTVYAITDRGRQVLETWLATPPTREASLDFEGLTRVMLAPFGQTADLAATLRQVQQDAAAMHEVATRIGQEYLAGQAPFQRYVQHRALMHDFLSTFALMTEDWAARSLVRVVAWEEESAESREAAALARIAEVDAELTRRK
jgi:PadR family transcriptional regulator, regulatory protein AphA